MTRKVSTELRAALAKPKRWLASLRLGHVTEGELIALTEECGSQIELARRLGVTPQAIRYSMQIAGISKDFRTKC
jgi:hypothetical protein